MMQACKFLLIKKLLLSNSVSMSHKCPWSGSHPSWAWR